MNVSLIDLWNQSGTFAKGIVIVLAIMSVYSLTIAVTKWLLIKRSTGATRKFAPQFSRAIEENNYETAISLADRNKSSHISRVLGGALVEMKPLLSDRAVMTAADINSAERAIERQMLLELTDFKRGLGIMATVGSTAPFVGLLGTCMGDRKSVV